LNPGALFCLLFAHFVADFPLQPQHIVKLRYDQDKRKAFRGNLLHVVMHLLLSAVFVLHFWSWRMGIVVITIALSHFIIDSVKSKSILKRPFRKYSIFVFLSDQAAHLICIFLALLLINRTPDPLHIFEMLTGELQEFMRSSFVHVTYGQKLVLSMMLMVIGLWGTGVFIRIVLNRMSFKPYRKAINSGLVLVNPDVNIGTEDGGFIIGILERLFIIISIVLNMPIVIGFILTVKSVARFKKLEDERFAEIFIIGSFISFISAIIVGYMIKWLQIIPFSI